MKPIWNLFTRPVWGGMGLHFWLLCIGGAIAGILALAGYIGFEVGEVQAARTLVGLMPYTFPVICISLPFIGWRKRQKLVRVYIIWMAIPIGVWLGLLATVNGIAFV